MKLKHLLLAVTTATLSLSASAANPNATVDQVRIYINPGHGAFCGNCRPMSTIKHGNQTSSNVGTDTAGFFESNTNLEKGFGLLEKLIEYGVPFDRTRNQTNSNAEFLGAARDLSQNLVMSRVKSGDVHNGIYDRPLSDIAEEADANNFDMFISIHSNATTGDHNVPTHLNHCLYLYRGYDGKTYSSSQSASIEMATKSWPHAMSNKHMNYNWLSNPNQPHNNESYSNNKMCYYPSGKDADGNPYWIKGDLTFQYGLTSGDSYIGYYGVLKHDVPGFLVEGYDHTYQPGLHRALNDDVARHEGEMYARGINDYFGWGIKDSYGKIYGIVRDHSVVMDNPYYQVTRSNTVDANTTINQIDNKKPLNFVIVQLYNSAGTLVDTYTTDDEWNGAYFFKKVPPGTYTIKHIREGYQEVTQTVTVTANATNYLNIDMRSVADGTAVQGHYAYGLSLAKTDDETYTATFKSTGAMSNGKIILTNSSTGEKTAIETGAISKGSNTVTIDATQFDEGVNYTWAVALDNPASAGYKQLYSDNSITYTGTYKARIGLAIDNDETSANFGTIYTITGYGQGMQKYNPDFSKNGGKFLTSYFGISNISNSVRLETNSGKVYIANNDASSAGVWVWNPVNSSHSKVISTKAAGVAFSGSGSSRKMYISNTNCAYGYNIGSADTWSSGVSTTYSNIGTNLPNGDGDIFATDNAVVASQIRYAPNNATGAPAFIVTNLSGNITFNSPTLNTEATDGSSLEGCNGGGFAFSKDKSIFAIQEGATNNTAYDAPVKIYAVRWNGSTPTFVYQYTIPLSGTYAIDQMAFDHADNLYIASRQKGLLVYAIKNPARQTVTNGAGTITGAKPATPLYIVGNAAELGAWDTEKAVEVAYESKNYSITLGEAVTEFKISTNKGDLTTFNNGNLTPAGAITNGGTLNLIADKDGGNIALPWAGVWTITVAGDLSTLTATTSTPNPNEGPEIGVEPEDAPNPDAEPTETEEPEDAQTEGYFAYGLSSSKSGNEYTFSFKSTGARKNGRIVLTNKSTGTTTEIKTPIVKGQNTVKINAYDIAKGDYTWAVKMTNNANSTVTQVGNYGSVAKNSGRIGLALDKDQTSEFFGQIYTSTGLGGGLQKINPDMTKNGNELFAGYFGKDTDASTSSNKNERPSRLEVEQGKLYIANYSNSRPGVWEFNPKTNALSSSSIETSPQYEKAVAFYGTGSNRRVYVYNENNIRRYNIGTATTWAQTGFSNSYHGVLINGDGDVLITNNAVIASQHRFKGLNDANVPAFVVLDHNLNLKFNSSTINSTLNGTQVGGMAITPDYKTFAIVDAYPDGSPADINIQVYNVSWNGSTPTFTHQYTIPLSGTKQVDQMEFDHAGNLLLASRQKGLLKYAVKTSARATVTNSTATVTGLGNPVPTNVVATRQCYGEGNNTTEGSVDAKVTWTGDAGQYKVYYQTMRRDAAGNRVNDNNGTWVEAGTATIASGSTSGSFTHKNLEPGDGYNRIYNYKVANYYSAANYASEVKSKSISGKGRTVTSAVSTVPVNVTLTQPSTVVDGVTQYSLDLKLDIALNQDVFNSTLLDDNDELVKATKYVIVVDEATAKALNAASNVSETGRFYEGPATMTSNNCNHHVINDWYMVVDFEDVTPSGDLSKATKSITWEDVDLSMTYKPQVYTSAVRTFNFTDVALSKQIEFPTPQWSANNATVGDNGELNHIADVIPVKGDQISTIVGTEDYPMGTFRKVGDTENATNPVSITKANVIGVTGVIEPLPATDDIMNEWDITYTFMVKDAQGNVISTLPQESKNNTTDANLYSNTKKVMVDVLGLAVGSDQSQAPDGRTRYTYNAEKNANYKLVVQTTYSRVVDGETESYSNETETDIMVNPSFPNPEIDPINSPGYIFLETGTHWDADCASNGGYYKYYYDAAMDIAWNSFNDNLVRYMGYYANPKRDCVGHTVAGSSEWVPYLAASVLTDDQVTSYNSRLGKDQAPLTGIGYTGSNEWSTLSASARHIPVKVHYVWAGNEKLASDARGEAEFDWELSANYPVVVYNTPLLKINSTPQDGGAYDITEPVVFARSVPGYDMQVITATNQNYKELQMDGVIEAKVTTGVDGVNPENGKVIVYPNPATDFVTIKSPFAIEDVKILSSSGLLVKEIDADGTQLRVDVSDLAPGIYVVRIADQSQILIKK